MKFKILAIRYISQSELERVLPKYFDYSDIDNLEKILHELGMDTEMPYEEQLVLHRNSFNEIKHCKRWVGEERIDADWIASGYASEAAKDKASNNKLLADLYRTKGETE